MTFTIYLTTECNFKCKYCYEQFSDHLNLSEKNAFKIVDYIMGFTNEDKIVLLVTVILTANDILFFFNLSIFLIIVSKYSIPFLLMRLIKCVFLFPSMLTLNSKSFFFITSIISSSIKLALVVILI